MAKRTLPRGKSPDAGTGNANWIRVMRFVDGPAVLDDYRRWLSEEEGYTVEQLHDLPYWPEILERRPDLQGL